MASSEGGVEIEVVAAEHPEKILKEFIDPSVGFQAFQARKLAFGLGLEGKVVNEAARLLSESLSRLRSHGRLTGRDQPFRHHDRRKGLGARRQDEL